MAAPTQVQGERVDASGGDCPATTCPHTPHPRRATTGPAQRTLTLSRPAPRSHPRPAPRHSHPRPHPGAPLQWFIFSDVLLICRASSLQQGYTKRLILQIADVQLMTSSQAGASSRADETADESPQSPESGRGGSVTDSTPPEISAVTTPGATSVSKDRWRTALAYIAKRRSSELGRAEAPHSGLSQPARSARRWSWASTLRRAREREDEAPDVKPEVPPHELGPS